MEFKRRGTIKKNKRAMIRSTDGVKLFNKKKNTNELMQMFVLLYLLKECKSYSYEIDEQFWEERKKEVLNFEVIGRRKRKEHQMLFGKIAWNSGQIKWFEKRCP